MNRYIALQKIVELGSFSKAADALGYTQSSMSQMIASLEDELSMKLLNRLRSGVTLTIEGMELYPYVERAIYQYTAMEEKAKEMEKKLPEVPRSTSNHYANFLLACQGKEKARSPFEIAGPLSQVLNLGVVSQRLNKRIKFDRETKRITNNPFADALLTGEPPRKGWEDFYKI